MKVGDRGGSVLWWLGDLIWAQQFAFAERKLGLIGVFLLSESDWWRRQAKQLLWGDLFV
jgi:hypothetical protein